MLGGQLDITGQRSDLGNCQVADSLPQIDVAGVRRGVQDAAATVYEADTQPPVVAEDIGAAQGQRRTRATVASSNARGGSQHNAAPARSTMLRPPITASLFNCWMSPAVACKTVVPAMS
ncbi:MAG: hypothetical protein AW11_01350 [Candidatus Accumulibacter regalis]|uniref:Uncharacterized protein n=1 Tax=Accumulibacter regalis TaxID=522306 RepID=A0A011QJV9_ACCRE|nr:MAG: hypothetical protein AW11_01350 [Candidatus Accumulibacter regalis]